MHSPRFQHNGKSYALLTWTSAMSCWSWSLPAGRDGACPAEHRGPNSICSSCYAQQGNYLFRNVQETQAARFAFLKSDPAHFADILVRFLHIDDHSFFRVHDSGDFHSLGSIHMWTRIVDRCPATRFWFPTRTHNFPAWLPALRAAPPQTQCLRPSVRPQLRRRTTRHPRPRTRHRLHVPVPARHPQLPEDHLRRLVLRPRLPHLLGRHRLHQLPAPRPRHHAP